MCEIKLFLGAFVLSVYFILGDSANILSAFPLPSKSHDILGSVLLKRLAKEGHNVTYISAFPHHNFKNFHHIHIKGSLQYKEENIQQYMQGNHSMFNILQNLIEMGRLTKIFYETEGVRNLLNSDVEFQLFINFMGMDATMALAYRFNTPIVLFSPVGGFPYHNELTGNPAPYSYVPNIILPYTDEMNFIERTINTIVSSLIASLVKFIAHFMANSYIKEYFPEYPTMDTITKRVDLILMNTHISTESARPYVPNIIQIGGFHLQEPEPLSDDLRRVLDDAKDGFIYFSFGTNVNVKKLPENVLHILIKVLGSLPLKVIFKYEETTIANKPDNFYIGTWFPQPSVLAHPNAKLFISHGGYGGSTESLFYGVPMICIPFFGDQPKNCADAEHNQYSVTLNLDSLSEETLSDALQKVLYDLKFKDAIKFKSELYRDQPMNPMDKAVYWIEHVIKHKGAKHLKVKGADLPWYQYHLLDVYMLIGAVLYIIFSFIYYFCKCICRKLCLPKNKIKLN